MDNLEEILKLLFRRISARQVLDNKISALEFGQDEFVSSSFAYMKHYSEPELENMWMYYYDILRVERRKEGRSILPGSRGFEVFDPLFYYASRMLVVQNNEIRCRYEHMKHWKEVTTSLSEDLLICAYWARTKTADDMSKIGFAWPVVIGHNNIGLTRIMERGISENHFHLYGSAPIFHISWISLMNHVLRSKTAENLQKYDMERRNANVRYNATYVEDGLTRQYRQAALIRVYLFSKLEGLTIQFGDGSSGTLSLRERISYALAEETELESCIPEIQNLLDTLRNNSIHSGYLPMELSDYALQGETDDFVDENDVYSGERWFLYACLKRIWMGTMGEWEKNLFYAYILMKENIRAELIQSNDNVGFVNFQKYERRKGALLDSPIFRDQMVRLAVRETLLRGNVKSLELRVSPKNTIDGNCDRIKMLDGLIGEPKSKYFYTFHFIKEKDSVSPGEDKALRCRHYTKRMKLRKQTDALIGMRERNPECAARVLGIDAASNEIGCRPEVFAPSFRRLRNHVKILDDSEEKIAIPQLRATYHVGEDFLDVTDGLRAIDETINFLRLDCGDRLGHALALGIDVDDWYRSKNYRILITQQDYLDNIAWLYQRIVDLVIPDMDDLKSYLEKKYEQYFENVYGQYIDFQVIDRILKRAEEYYKKNGVKREFRNDRYRFGISQYYNAWKLRGDDPELYGKGFYEERVMSTPEEECLLNRDFPKEYSVRFSPESFLLYYYYHFDPNVKREGAKRVEVKIRPMFVEGVKAVQHVMQRRIEKRGIAIETNPTSNVVIGTFRDYAKHPIFRWYNYGLTATTEEMEKCPMLSVSINTDDMGVFGTSLENEYALLASALENMTDSSGNRIYPKTVVYEWLDDVRKMGNDQSFRPKEEDYRRLLERWP